MSSIPNPPSATPHPGMPPGIQNAYWFQVFNTVSWQISQGLPILLFFKYLGASDTILGIASALNPLMNLLQIPAASHVERIGYRSFVLRGWFARTFFVAGIATVPLLLFVLDKTTCLVLTLFFLFGFSTLRGISLCGFLPWMTQLVPEKVRGTFIANDQMFGSIAGLLTMLSIALLFKNDAGHSNILFTIVFAVSFFAGLISLIFLRKMPDVAVMASPSNQEKVPWKEMLFYPPFFRLMQYNIVFHSALAGAVFWIAALRNTFHWTDTQITLLTLPGGVVTIWALWFFGKMIDRVGSQPLLTFSGILLSLHFFIWAALACHLLPFNFYTIVALALTSGVGVPAFTLANTRLAMATVPEMGRSHFFALFSVINSVTLGVLPVVWGIVLDALRPHEFAWGSLVVTNYTVLYVVLALTMLVSLFFRSRLKEARALTHEQFLQELLVDTPARALTRLINRANTIIRP